MNLIIIVFYLSLINQDTVQSTITDPHPQPTTVVQILLLGVQQRCFTLKKCISVSTHKYYWLFHFELMATNESKIHIVTENFTMLWRIIIDMVL